MAKFEATPEQIAAWKKKYGDIFQLNVDDRLCYLYKPNPLKLGRIIKNAPPSVKKNPLKCCEIILRSCWLSGDPEILMDDGLLLSAATMMDDLISYK